MRYRRRSRYSRRRVSRRRGGRRLRVPRGRSRIGYRM